MRFAAAPEEEVSINLTPLIDIVFLLLIFFMVSTTFNKETKLEIALPEAGAQGAPDLSPSRLILAITAGGEYQLAVESKSEASEFQTVQAGELRVFLRVAAEKHREAVLVLKADAKTTHQAVVWALDAARKAGIEKVMFSAQAVDG